MQGTASAAEDTRQPPYLCPVDDAKLNAIIAERVKGGRPSGVERDRALLGYCRKHAAGGAFAAYQKWLEQKLAAGVDTIELD